MENIKLRRPDQIITVVVLVLLFLGLTLSTAVPANILSPTNFARAATSEGDSQYFSQTDHTIAGKFLAYWQNNGGLAHFGFPLTEAQNETNPQTRKTLLTQWFERSRFELHSEFAGTAFEIEQGLLGSELNREAIEVDPIFQRTLPTKPLYWYNQSQDFEYIQETGHNISGYFLKYWLERGGVAQFGLPISEETNQSNGFDRNGASLRVQWFERARFELHPELLQPPPTPGSFPTAQTVPIRAITATSALTTQPEGANGSTATAAPVKTVSIATNVINAPANTIVASTVLPSPIPVSQLPGQPILLGLLGDELKAPNLLPRSSAPTFVWQTGPDHYNYNNSLASIAIDSRGNIFGSDSAANFITKYDSSGHRVAVWPMTTVNEQKNLYAPAAIAIDNQDNIFIANSGDNYIYRFDSNGHLLLKWGGKGNQDGQFAAPKGISADSEGNLYVADTGNDRVQKFDNNGHFLTKWGSRGGYDGQFFNPEAVVPDNQGHVFVADTLDNMIEKFDTAGHFIKKWGGYSTAQGKFKAPRSLAINTDPNTQTSFLYTLETYDTFGDGNARVQKFDLDGNFVLAWGGAGFGDDQFRRPQALSASKKEGSVYVTDSNSHSIKKFDDNGHFQAKFSTFGTAVGQFVNPVGVTTDNQHNIYVTDTGNARVQKFDQGGRFLLSIGTYGYSGSDGQFDYPVGVAVDGQGNIFVSDSNSGRIQKFDQKGHFVVGWGSPGQADGQFQLPPAIDLKSNPYGLIATQMGGVAVDKTGNVYVADTGNSRVQKFDNQGHFLAKWNLGIYFGTGPSAVGGLFGDLPSPQGPTDLAIDSQDNVYVVSTLATPVLKFDTNGQLLLKWSPIDTSNPKRPPPTGAVGVAVDSVGNIYLSDIFDHSIAKFAGSDGHLIQQWGQFESDYSYTHAPFRGIAINAPNDLLTVGFEENSLSKYHLP